MNRFKSSQLPTMEEFNMLRHNVIIHGIHLPLQRYILPVQEIILDAIVESLWEDDNFLSEDFELLNVHPSLNHYAQTIWYPKMYKHITVRAPRRHRAAEKKFWIPLIPRVMKPKI